MLAAMWRLSAGYRLAPWRSPYLKWRIETYSGLHAETLSSRDVLSFFWKERRQLLHFLHWADRMASS